MESFGAAFAKAVQAKSLGILHAYDQAIDALYLEGVNSDGKATAAFSGLVVDELSRRLRRCWEGGWEPADIVSLERRLDSAPHGVVAAAAVCFDSRHDEGKAMHPRWREQLDDIASGLGTGSGFAAGSGFGSVPSGDWMAATVGAVDDVRLGVRGVIELCVDMAAQIVRLPVLAPLIPPPGPAAAAYLAARRAKANFETDSAGSGSGSGPGGPGASGGSGASTGAASAGAVSAETETKMLSRVRALLAKAESTEFPDEAEAFTAKAQELMARYSIDAAMVAGAGGAHDGPSGRRIHLEQPYVEAKASLVDAVANANRCRAILHSAYGFMTVMGFDHDLAAVDLLFTSLLAQASAAMVHAAKVDKTRRSSSRSFRQSFLVAFAHRIGERLAEAAATTVSDASVDYGTSVAMVLAERDHEVEEAVAVAFPRLSARRTRVRDAAGWHAGTDAAEKASLQPRRHLPKPSR